LAAGAPTVTVTLGDGSQHVVTLDESFPQDRPAGSFVCRIPGGQENQLPLPTGWSIRSIIAKAGADPDTTYSATIAGAGGPPVVLHTEDFADASENHAFVQGQGVPLVYVKSGNQPDFFRPERDTSDVNCPDQRFGIAENLDATLVTGAILRVTARADRTKVDPGQPVHFTSTIHGLHDGETVTYKWNFGDGRTSSVANPTHVFTTGGRIYTVNLTVTGEGSGGSAPALKITVGHRAGGTGSGDGNHGHQGSGSQSGPNGNGGNGKTASTTGGQGTSSKPAGHHHTRASGGGGVHVDGVLISGTASEQAPSAPQRAFGTGGTDTPGPALGGAVSGLLAAGLFAFGAYRESHRSLLRRPPARTKATHPGEAPR
jgi:hypothetical protein